MELSIVPAHRFYQIAHIGGICQRMPCNAECIGRMAFVHVMRFPHQFGNVAIGFYYWNCQFTAEPQNKRFAHYAHKSGIPHRVASLLLIQSDLPFVKQLMAMLTESYQVIGRIASCLAAFQMMHMELDPLLCGRMRPTALACLIIPF